MQLDTEEYVCKKFFDDILPDITRSMNEAIGILQIIPEKGTIPQVFSLLMFVISHWTNI